MRHAITEAIDFYDVPTLIHILASPVNKFPYLDPENDMQCCVAVGW